MSRLLIGKGGLFCGAQEGTAHVTIFIGRGCIILWGAGGYGTCYNIHRETLVLPCETKKMNWHFVLPRVALAYTWSHKVPHFSVSQSDCECFPIEYCTLCLSTPRGLLCTVSAMFEFHDCPLVDLSKSGGAVTAE